MKKDLTIALIALLVVGAACYVLASVRPARPLTPSQPFTEKAASTAKRVEGKVVMRVNGEPITETEFQNFIQSAPAESRAFYASPQGRRALAEELVKLKVLEQEGKRLGIGEEPDVRNQVDSVRAQIIAGKTLEKLVKDSVEQRVRAEYEKEKGKAMTLRHILVAYQGGQIPARSGQPLPEPQAMAKATAIVARLKAGANYAEMARRVSDDTQSAQRGGSLGPTKAEILPPDIAAAISKLKPGQISDPVRTQYGIHIFMVETPSFEELRPMLTQQMQRQAIDETVGRLQRGAKIDLDPVYFPQPRLGGGTAKSNG